MSASLSNVSLGTYIQMVSAASNIIEKAEEFCKENNIDSQELVEMQLYKDMSPFSRRTRCFKDRRIWASKDAR